MVTVIKKGADKKEIQRVLANIKTAKSFDAYKYCGVVSLKEDPLLIQKKLRDDWE